MTDDEILAALHQLQSGDLPVHGGRTLAYVYDPGLAGLSELAAAAHAGSAHANGLDPTAFGSIAAMEADLVATAAGLLGGGPDTVGTITSGGTESCLLAVLTARNARPDLTDPSMVLPSTVHAAFHKAAEMFGVRAIVVDVDPQTHRADPVAVAAAIDDSTVLVVCSTPSYAHGVIDPVVEIAAAAAAAGVPCHVDACIGGWLLAGFRDLGRELPPFDLAVPGVTSLSVDLHKYAYAPKGTSVLLFDSAERRAPGYFVFTRWPGYAMLNPTLQSTRSGGPVAAAWATVSSIGPEGYRSLARRAATAFDAVLAAVASIDGLRVLGEPTAGLIAVAATEDGPNVFALADEMNRRGWYVQPQFGFRGGPPNVHLTVTAPVAEAIDELTTALREATASAAETIVAATDLGGALAGFDPADPAALGALAGGLGLLDETGAFRLPQRMAGLNTALDALSAEVRAMVLRMVLSLVHRPGRDLLES